MGDGAVIEASTVSGNFNNNDRVADPTRIPLAAQVMSDREDFREALAINRYLAAKNSLAHSALRPRSARRHWGDRGLASRWPRQIRH